MKLAPVAVVSAAFLLASCQPPAIEFEVARHGDQYVATLSQSDGFLWKRSPPCIDHIELYEGGDAHVRGRTVWKARYFSSHASCRRVEKLVLGELPIGFAEIVPFAAHLKGPHGLYASGAGQGRVIITFD